MTRQRGYALILVLMVLALLAVALGTLFAFQEGSATTTGSLYERRRAFYACDGIGRAATVVAQDYLASSVPSTQGLIDAVCTVGGGGCCATTADTSTNPTAGGCEPILAANRTRLTDDPAGDGPTALPLITPPGFKIMELSFSSEAEACATDAQCDGGTCVGGFCRTVGALPSGPFEGMIARQDTISLALTAEHRATTRFRCATSQTMTLGKIALFQFFLFSDSAYTDWHPGVIMRADGRMHANGNVGLDGRIRIARITASGQIGCMSGASPPNVNLNCGEPEVRIAQVATPDMTDDNDFASFLRDASWQSAALARFGNGNAQDASHGVPRLQLPIVGQPDVQRGYDASNAHVGNFNSAVVAGVTREFPNSRLLVDPVRASDTLEVRRQKFAHNADIRIINGAWFLKNPANENDWPGVPIWSDHGTHAQRADEEFVGAARNIGQAGLTATWAARVPQRFSYYGAQLAGGGRLSRDLDPGASSTLRPDPFTQTAVVSYGALFRDASAGEHAAVWRPGVRTMLRNGSHAWCQSEPGLGNASPTIIDALAVGGAAGSPCDGTGVTQAAALLAATRSGFRDGFAELEACGNSDNVLGNPGTCDGNGRPDRRRGNILPINFDLHAFQEALADRTAGELGSYFCPPGVPTCGAFMGRPFNGIVYLAAPYPGSERGYGSGGGINVPVELPIPGRLVNAAGTVTALHGVNYADHLEDAGLAAGRARHDVDPLGADPATRDSFAWGAAGTVPVLIDRGDDATPSEYREARDDEVAALPYPLCSDPSATSDVLTSGGYQFVRPDCGLDTTFTRINAVRLINARRVNSNVAPTTPAEIDGAALLPPFAPAPVLSATAVGQLPDGLSIITNLPIYVVGDVNLTSDAWAPAGSAAHWVPVLIGGDVVHLLSNAWDDANARWAQSTARQTRVASVARYHAEILGGWGMSVASAASGGLHNFPRALEDWSSGDSGDCGGLGDFSGACPSIIRGSLVIGHHRVYTSWRFREGPGIDVHTRRPPRRDWGFDPHLIDIDRQPPGTPLFDVSAVRQWTRN